MLDEYLLTKNQTIAVALSGGKDSVCLLHMLLGVKDRLNITVKAVNVEHGIRGESSLADSEFCRSLCKKLGVEIKSYSVNVPEYVKEHGVSEETAARILRYECFDNALIGGFCDKIATAHHLSDSVETVLFNLFRGTSSKGVCGIEKTAKNGKIIRPLLSCTREEIDDYAKEHNLEYVTDESNFNSDYSRNFIRNEIMPLVRKNFPAAERNIQRFSAIMREEDELLDRLAAKYIDDNTVIFSDEGDALFCRACLTVMKEKGFTVDYEAVHLQAICNLKTAQCGTRICLKNGLTAVRTQNGVAFEKNVAKITDEVPFALGMHVFGDYVIKFEKILPTEELKTQLDVQKKTPTDLRQKTPPTSDRLNGQNADKVLYFDLDKLPYSTVIRTKRDGDVILSFGGKTKILKKYLGDNKLESRISKNYPLLACGNEIFCVCPVDIGEKIKIDQNTVNTVRITITTRGDNDAQRS